MCVFTHQNHTPLDTGSSPYFKVAKGGHPFHQDAGGGKHINSVVPGVPWIGASGALPTHCIVFCKF